MFHRCARALKLVHVKEINRMKLNRRVSLSLSIMTSMAAAPSTSFAQLDLNNGFYLAGSLGAALQNGHSFSVVTQSSSGSTSSEGNANLGTGLSATFAPGLAFNDNLRSDIEFSYRDKPGKGDGIAEKAYSAIADVWVDVLHQYGYFIYFGGGLGLAEINLQDSGNGSDSDIAPAWQIGGGAGLTLLSHWALSADFRRLTGFDKSTFDLQGNQELKTRYDTNAVTLSLRYSFGALPSPLFDFSLFGQSDE